MLKGKNDTTADAKEDRQGERDAARSCMALDASSDGASKVPLENQAEQNNLADDNSREASAPKATLTVADVSAASLPAISKTEEGDSDGTPHESGCHLSSKERNASGLLDVHRLPRETHGVAPSLSEEFCRHPVSRENLRYLPFLLGCSVITPPPDDLHSSYQAALPVASLGLPVSANTVCESLGVSSLGRLLLTSPDEFTYDQTCGMNTVEVARNTIEEVLLNLAPAIEEFCQRAVSRENLRRLPFFRGCSVIKLRPEGLHSSYQAALPVASLGLPVSANTVCASLGVTSLGELLLTSADEFTYDQTCGIGPVEVARNTIEEMLLNQLPAIMDATADVKGRTQGDGDAARSCVVLEASSDNANEAPLEKGVEQDDLVDHSSRESSATRTTPAAAGVPAASLPAISNAEEGDGNGALLESAYHLSFKEQNALELLGIHTVDEFFRTDLTRVLCLKGYGVETYNKLKGKQRKVRRTFQTATMESSVSRETYPEGQEADESLPWEAECPLRFKERKALRLLGVETLEEFLHADLSHVLNLPYMGDTTYQGLSDKQRQLQGRVLPHTEARSILDSPISHVVDLGARERNLLNKLEIGTVREFLRLDLRSAMDIRGCGETTCMTLEQKHRELTQKCATEIEENGLTVGSAGVLTPYKDATHAAQSLREQFCNQEVSRRTLRQLPFFGGATCIDLHPGDLHASYQAALPVASLGLPARANTACKSLGVVSLGELLLTFAREVTDMQNCGMSTLESARNTIEGVLLDEMLAITVDTSSYSLFLESVFSPVLPDSRTRDIVLARIGADGEVLTLQELAGRHGITKERVRQIEKTARERLLLLDSQIRLDPLRGLLCNTLSVLKGAASLETIGKALASQFVWSTVPPCRVVETLVSLFPKDFHTVDAQWCIDRNYQCYECARFSEIAIRTLGEATEAGASCQLSLLCLTMANAIAEQCETCQVFPGEPVVPEAIVPALIQMRPEVFVGYFCDGSDVLLESTRISKKVTLQDVVEKAVLEASGPVCPDEIRDMIISDASGSRDSLTVEQVRSVLNNTLVQRGEVLLWNRGGEFVHCSKVNPYLPILNTLEAVVIEMLSENSVPQMSLYHLFEKHKEDYIKAGLPSVWAVFSLLKLRAHPRLRFLRAPYVAFHDSASRQKQSVVDLLSERVYLEEGGISDEEIREYAATSMGMTKVHFGCTMQFLDDVLRTDSGYFHAEHFDADSANFRMLVLQTRKILEQRDHVSATFLFKEKEVTCLQLGITGPRMLASVLEYFASDSIGEVVYPMIRAATEGSRSETISVYREVESHILESCGPCSRERIAKCFVEQRGYGQRQVSNAVQNLRSSGELLPYGEGLFVHEKTIGWNKHKHAELMATVLKYYSEHLSARCIHVRIPMLLDEIYAELPDLDHGVDWSEQLLFSLVIRDPAILPLGNANRAFLVPSDSKGRRCFGDFVKWVLVDRFQGGANLREFAECLREMDVIRKSLTPRMLNEYDGLVMSEHEIRVAEKA